MRVLPAGLTTDQMELVSDNSLNKDIGVDSLIKIILNWTWTSILLYVSIFGKIVTQCC